LPFHSASFACSASIYGMKKFDLTFATCELLPNLDQDDLATFSILQQRGWQCQPAVWNDPAVDWNNAGLIVLRSTWDYHLQPQAFLRWAQSCAANLLNEFDLISWNVNKRYLLDLEQRGVSIIPSELIAANSPAGQLDRILAAHNWAEIVIKPVFGASSFGVQKFAIASQLAEAQAHVKELLANADALIQPFLPSVSGHGERALSFIDGIYSHCIRKTPFQKMGSEHGGQKAIVAPECEIVFAQKVLSTLPKKPLYARVDLLPGADGEPLLMELELVEPSLFLGFDSLASARFANALERRLQQRCGAPQPTPVFQAIAT
jgi:glutathione synthase/RimK-type ligase-like ATP-grasp enzyme